MDRSMAALFGWHRHSDHHTEVQVLSGAVRLDMGRAKQSFDAGAGDFVHIPAHLDPRLHTAQARRR